MHPLHEAAHAESRRRFLTRSGIGLGAVALSSLLAEGRGEESCVVPDPLTVKPPHFAPKAKRVIYLHMIGAPGHLDLFDHKPALAKHDGEICPESFLKGKRFAFIGGELKLAGSPFNSPGTGNRAWNCPSCCPTWRPSPTTFPS